MEDVYKVTTFLVCTLLFRKFAEKRKLDEERNRMDKVDGFLAYLAADRGYSPLTVEVYRGDLRHFESFFQALDGNLGWKNVDSDIIRRWMAERMEKGISPRSVKRSLSALRSFYKYLLKLNDVQHDPTQLIRNPKVPKTLPSFVKQSEMDRLLDGVTYPDGFEGMRDRLILLTFYTTGVRVSELVGLNVENLDLQNGELKVTGKRNKQRIIPFGEELKNDLSVYLSVRHDEFGLTQGPLFVSMRGLRMSVPEVREVVRYYLSMVTTQKKKTPHVLRHTFATVMLNNGADLGAVKELLGHESLATTEIYTHTTFAELRKEYEKAHPRSEE